MIEIVPVVPINICMKRKLISDAWGPRIIFWIGQGKLAPWALKLANELIQKTKILID